MPIWQARFSRAPSFVRRACRAVLFTAVTARGKFSPHEMHGERENGEDKQNIHMPVRHMFVKNFHGPQNQKHEEEQEKKHLRTSKQIPAVLQKIG